MTPKSTQQPLEMSTRHLHVTRGDLAEFGFGGDGGGFFCEVKFTGGLTPFNYPTWCVGGRLGRLGVTTRSYWGLLK